MKTIVCCVAAVVVLLGGAFVYAQAMSESEYRSRWASTEDSFAQQHKDQVRLEEKKKNVQELLQMGKDYLDKKDYATALSCFRSVIDLENELGSKDNVEFAQSQMARIEIQMQQEIKQDLNNVFGKNWPRREEGLKRILDRMPSTYTQKWAEEQEQKRIAAIEAEKKKARDEMRRRKLDLEQQVLQKSLEVNEELYIKRLELLKKQVEVDEILRYAKELFADHSYTEAIEAANKALAIDPNSGAAKSIRDDAAYRLEEEKIAVSKKEEDTQRAIQDMKRRQVEETRKKQEEDIANHLLKGKDLFARNEFIDAITEFKTVLKLDSENLEAKLFIEQIKMRLDKAKSALENVNEEPLVNTQGSQSEDQKTSAVTLDQGQPTMTLSEKEVGLPVNATLNPAPQALRLVPKTNLSIPSAKPEVTGQVPRTEAPAAIVKEPLLHTPQASQSAVPVNADQVVINPESVPVPAQAKPQAQVQSSSTGAAIGEVQTQDSAHKAAPIETQAQPGKTSEAPAIQKSVPQATDTQPMTPGEILMKSSSGSK